MVSDTSMHHCHSVCEMEAVQLRAIVPMYYTTYAKHSTMHPMVLLETKVKVVQTYRVHGAS